MQKKMLRALHRDVAIDPGLVAPQRWITSEIQFRQQLDQQKREQEKRQAGGEPGGKLFLETDPEF